jgi:uncharacterized membrane protein (DUF485 family)
VTDGTGTSRTFTRSRRPAPTGLAERAQQFDLPGQRRGTSRFRGRCTGLQTTYGLGRCQVRDELTLHERVQSSPDFTELRSRLRRFVFPMSAAFMLWYLGYVLLASYAPDVMAIPVFGHINVGILVGLLQFVSTFVITSLYVRYADAQLDPMAASIRTRMEGR